MNFLMIKNLFLLIYLVVIHFVKSVFLNTKKMIQFKFNVQFAKINSKILFMEVISINYQKIILLFNWDVKQG